MGLEAKGGAGARRVLALQAVSGTEELLDVVRRKGLQVVQVAVKVEQVVVQGGGHSMGGGACI